MQFNGFHLGRVTTTLELSRRTTHQGRNSLVPAQKLKGEWGVPILVNRNIMEEAENTDTVQQDEIIMGSISLKDLMKKVGNKEKRYHRIAPILIVCF